MLRSPRAALLVLAGIALLLGAARSFSGLLGCNGTFSTFHGPTQTDGAHDTANVAKVAAFKRRVTWQRSEADGIHHLFVHFVPTEGVWRPREKLTFQIQLKQPCDRWQFASGFGSMIDKTSGPETNTAIINVSTGASPKPGEDVVIDIQARTPPEVDKVAMSPREPESADQ